jgi:hypothetical protein
MHEAPSRTPADPGKALISLVALAIERFNAPDSTMMTYTGGGLPRTAASAGGRGSPLSLSPDGLSVMVVQQFAAILLLQWTYSRRIELASLSSLCAV